MWQRLQKFRRFIVQAVENVLSYRAPKFEPKLWGPANDVQYDNNCYNYACDIKGTYAQPGLASGYKFKDFNCNEIGRGLVSDGLLPIDCTKQCRGRKHKVALTISPMLKTFHLYRLDRSGQWSHKPGDGPPTNLDYSGNIITDPNIADRGPFTILCGCYCVCKSRVSIE